MVLLDDELMIAARMPPPIAAKGEAGRYGAGGRDLRGANHSST
jgi:hypothetical protein